MLKKYCTHGAAALLSILIWLNAASLAVAQSAAEISNLVQGRYQNVQTIHAYFDQIITHKESGVEEKRLGEIFFQKPMLVRWHTAPPLEELILLTGDVVWQYFADEELAYKFDADAIDGQNGFLKVIIGQTRLDKNFKIEVLGDEGGLLKVLLEPYEPSQSMVEATMWINRATGEIARLRIMDFYANLSEITLNRQELDKPIPSSTFVFTPPPGTEIEDHTENRRNFSEPLKN